MSVNAGGGDDRVHGGGGDLIDGRGDGRAADTITCGAGDDTVRASRNDEVAADCEHLKQRGAKEHSDGPGNESKPPFDEDGKPGKGSKHDRP